MNLVVTPLSSDFKNNGAGFGERGFWCVHANHVHHKVLTFNVYIRGVIVYTFAWQMAVNSVVEMY